MHEVHNGVNVHLEPKAFQDRFGGDALLDPYLTKARRLYPLTLLGPKLASQVSAEGARAAGALAETLRRAARRSATSRYLVGRPGFCSFTS